eukprot:354908-Chlamydomonas_euryale.AAC.7
MDLESGLVGGEETMRGGRWRMNVPIAKGLWRGTTAGVFRWEDEDEPSGLPVPAHMKARVGASRRLVPDGMKPIDWPTRLPVPDRVKPRCWLLRPLVPDCVKARAEPFGLLVPDCCTWLSRTAAARRLVSQRLWPAPSGAPIGACPAMRDWVHLMHVCTWKFFGK